MDEQMPKHSGRWLVYKNVQSESPTWFTEEMDALDYLAAMRNDGYSVSLFREVDEMVMPEQMPDAEVREAGARPLGCAQPVRTDSGGGRVPEWQMVPLRYRGGGVYAAVVDTVEMDRRMRNIRLNRTFGAFPTPRVDTTS